MTLSEFAYVLDVDPKWVQNTAATLQARLRYDLPTAQRLAVARAIATAVKMPMPDAYAVAADVLQQFEASQRPVEIADDSGTVTLTLDVYRILSAVSVGLSRLRTMYEPMRRGRRSRRPRNQDPVAAARDYGIDVSLFQSTLARSPDERLRKLDEDAAFVQTLRRPR